MVQACACIVHYICFICNKDIVLPSISQCTDLFSSFVLGCYFGHDLHRQKYGVDDLCHWQVFFVATFFAM